MKKNSFITEWVIPIALAVVIAVLINKFLIFKAYIPSESMEPTLKVGDHIFVSRIYNYDRINRGDILVFESEELNQTVIKRVIGLPGDKVSIVHGQVFINGEKLDEEYVENDEDYTGEFKVPEDKYFFLGDNRINSKDGRYLENPYIDEKDIKGKAQLRIYPFNSFGRID